MVPFQIPAKNKEKGSINKPVTLGDLGLRCRGLILIFQTYDYRKADSRSMRIKGAFFPSALCSGLQVFTCSEYKCIKRNGTRSFFVGDLDFGAEYQPGFVADAVTISLQLYVL